MSKQKSVGLIGVCMLINTFYPSPPGGAERQAEQLCSFLVSQKYQVTVITRSIPSAPRVEVRDGYRIIRVPQFGPGRIRTLSFTLGAILEIFSRRKEFDILHAHLVHSPAFAAVVAGKLFGKKTIVKFGSSGSGRGVSKIPSLRRLIRMAVQKKWADRFVVLAESMKNDLIYEGYNPEKIVYMFNGVDTRNYSPASINQQQKNSSITRIIYTGRLVSDKNLPDLLRAFKKALEFQPEMQLILVGEGPEYNNLNSLVGELDLDKKVTFTGLVSNVRDYLILSDIFILPSLSEGNSNSLLEAMSCGLACISTNVGAADKVLDCGKCGILVEPDNLTQLTDALVCLASNQAERVRLGILARQRILDNYSIEKAGHNYIQLYEELINSQ